jgi:hypothetical protein
MAIAGVPQFTPGERVILFLSRTPRGTLAVTDLVLGAFRLMSDRAGRHVAVREESDVVGWDPNSLPYIERRRSTELFLDFLRAEGRGGMGVENYFVPTEPLVGPRHVASLAVSALAFTGNSYTSDVSGGRGARWSAFPGAVNVFSGANGEPGAPGNGTTAVQIAINSWDGDCASNVNYAYAGTDSTHTTGLAGPDGANTVLFERNLSQYGIGPFSCSGNSYGGTLGIGGITQTGGTHVLNGETFFTTTEGDVEMNQGIANCSALFNNGDWNSALTHEVGHTLGFRHADQTRANNPSVPCSSDPSLECSSSAIMRSSIPTGLNGALQAWDVNAVRSVYPGGTCGGTCTPPSITSQPQSITINGSGSTILSVTATGTAPLSYQWFTGASGNTANPIVGATGSSVTVNPSSTTAYWVRVSNACGMADSTTATVTVNAPPPPPPSPATGRNTDFNGDGKADIFWINSKTGETSIWFMNGSGPPTTVRSTTVPVGWSPLVFGDFNGDGRGDVFWRNASTGETSVWLMNGANFTSAFRTYTVPTAWIPTGAGDFNGDGRADVFWFNGSTGETSIWFMNGTPTPPTVRSITVPAGWKPRVFGDFSGDGKADIFWRQDSTGETSVWLMNGGNPASTFQTYTAPTAWLPMGAGDYNGDGKDDVFWRNTSTGENSVWFMNGTATPPTSTSPTAPLPWTPEVFGDFNGDLRGDVFWRNPSTGETSIWLMSGAAYSVAVRSLTVPIDWVPAP